MISSTVTLLMVVLMSHGSFAQMKMTSKAPGLSETDSLRSGMRSLWVDHITWTRNVVLCIVDDLPGKEQAIKRLDQNQVDLGNAIKPYYGNEAGEKLTNLLREHITIAVEVVEAANAGDTAVLAETNILAETNKKWHANADQISLFLSNANPHWALADVKLMMHEHLQLTTDAAVARIEEDYDADVVAYDKVQSKILKMSDMLSEGIVRQFPEKFKKGMIKTVGN